MSTSRIYILLVFILFSCNREKKSFANQIPSSDEINIITKTIIFDDTLDIVKENSTIPICNELKKLKTSSKHYKENRPYDRFETLVISDLVNNPKFPIIDFFNASDSSYIKSQLIKKKVYKLPQSIFGNLKSTTLEAGKKLDDIFFLSYCTCLFFR